MSEEVTDEDEEKDEKAGVILMFELGICSALIFIFLFEFVFKLEKVLVFIFSILILFLTSLVENLFSFIKLLEFPAFMTLLISFSLSLSFFLSFFNL